MILDGQDVAGLMNQAHDWFHLIDVQVGKRRYVSKFLHTRLDLHHEYEEWL